MKRLKELRIEKQIGLSDFCEKTGIPATRFSGIERGKFPPTLEEKLLIEREVGPFTTDHYNPNKPAWPPVCPAKHKAMKPVFDAGIKTMGQLEDSFEQYADDQRKTKVSGYTTTVVASDLYDRFISANEHSRLKDDQKQRLAELKIEALDLARSIVAKCPPTRFRRKALLELEATIDWAIKSIVLES